MDRRQVMSGGLALAAMPPAPLTAQGHSPPFERLPLWPGPPPGGTPAGIVDVAIPRNAGGGPDDIAWTHVATPTITVSRPARPNGTAVLLIPGGGYTRVAIGREPSAIARMFAATGVTAVELRYRLPHDGWAAGPDAPLQDAQRAMRLIRRHAASWSIDPVRVAAIGFSAGGHLAGRLASRAGVATYAPVDAVDALSARPIALGLFYSVVSMLPPIAHAPSRRELLGPSPDVALETAYSLERTVPTDMPPTFVCHAADDRTVLPANSLAMFAALQAAHIPSELMIGESGGHGVRLVLPGGRPHVWFTLFQDFAARHGWTAR